MTLRVIDLGGSVAVGGVSQLLASSFFGRRGLVVQNNSAQELWLNDTGKAATSAGGCWKVRPGDIFSMNPLVDGQVTIIGPVTGQSFTARQW